MTKHEQTRNFATWLILMGILMSIVWLSLGLGFIFAGVFVLIALYAPKLGSKK